MKENKREGENFREIKRENNLGRIKPSASRHLTTRFSPGLQSCEPARSLRYEQIFHCLVFTSTPSAEN